MRIILPILLLISLTANAQRYKKAIVTVSGVNVAYGYSEDASPDGDLTPIIIFLHGVDHKGAAGDTTTTSGIQAVATKGVPLDIVNGPIIVTNPVTGREVAVNCIFPQLPNNYSLWHIPIVDSLIDRIKRLYSNIYDTNKIYAVGYSLGGGGVLSAFSSSKYRANIKYCGSIAAGYNQYTNWAVLAALNCQFDFFHEIHDKLANINVSDNYVQALNSAGPRRPVQFRRMSGFIGGVNYHDIWPMVLDQIPGDSYIMSNGDEWDISETFYERIVRF